MERLRRTKLIARQILAHGLEDRLLHAEKAVEIAEWGLKKYGDDKGVGSELLALTQRTLGEVKARVDQEEEEMQEVEAQGQEGPAGEFAQEKSQEGLAGIVDPAATVSQPGKRATDSRPAEDKTVSQAQIKHTHSGDIE